MRPLRLFLKKGGLRCVKNAFLRRICGKDPAWYFSRFVFVGLGLFAVRCLAVGGSGFSEIFHLGTNDLFGDFFAAVSDAARGAAAYGERGVIYPPLANLLLLLFSRLLPRAYLTGGDAAAWRQYNGAVLFYLLFAVSSVLLLYVCARHFLKDGTVALALCLSFPVCFLLERGNMLLLALLPLLYFARYFESERPVLRELALVALGFCAALKLYPLLFSLVLLASRRWREFFRVLGYTAALCVLPSFFFGGPLALWLMAKNAFSFTASGQNATHFMAVLGLDAATGTLLLCGFYFLVLCAVLLAVILRAPTWQIFALCATSLLCFSSIFSAYNWLLFLPALFALFEGKCKNGVQWCCFWLMSAPFYVYLPKPWQDKPLILLLALLFAMLLLSLRKKPLT
ncbi:MAG: DUF2029 domain-containing protein [Ruminococcaceae bacterium]|nr:DUF2029 domain-containing protein [Oscillospiraceae bacterium]